MIKRFLFFGLILFFWSCSSGIEKPKNLISEQKLQQILYDLALLNASKNVDYAIFQNNFVDVENIIYKTHEIDSLQLAETMIYYATKPEVYRRIVEQIEMRISLEDSIFRENKKKSDSLVVPLQTDKNPDNPQKFLQ